MSLTGIRKGLSIKKKAWSGASCRICPRKEKVYKGEAVPKLQFLEQAQEILYMEGKNYFNEPKVDLNDLSLFPADIYERTKRNPNPRVSIQCRKNTKSLDDYAKRLAQELITTLKG